MSTKYWDIYVLYIKRCEKENYINDIDPNHYVMEWNHFWPHSIFGDWPVGQWLTKKQHAIASALQTLVFKENCMCGWHKSYIPAKLLELAWPYYRKAMCKNSKKATQILHAKKDENGKSIRALEMNKIFHSQRDENGLSLKALEICGLPRKAILVTFPDSVKKKFKSIKETARYFNCPPLSIRRRINKGSSLVRTSKFFGIVIELADEM